MLIKVLFRLIVRRKKPESIEEVLPSHDKLLEMAVRAQCAGASFAPASWLVSLLAGTAALFFDTALSPTTLFVWVAGSNLAWGYSLAWLGRHGFLPFMESE
jgi:hypothetical protein